MKLVACLSFALFFAVGPAAAQSIPVDIPDRPGESPSDREREKHEERYRPLISRAYVLTTVGASPLLHRDGGVFDTFVEAGFQLDEQVSIFIMGGPRIAPEMLHDHAMGVRTRGGYAGALGLEIHGGRYSGLENWAMSVAVGTWTSDVNIFVTEVSPRYHHRINSYWQVAAGVKATVASYSEGGVFFFAGPSIGIRRQFGQRRILE